MKLSPSHLAAAVALAIPPSPTLAQLLPLPESQESSIGYRTVDEALASLRMRPDVQISEQNGWTLVGDRTNYVYWSFAPRDDPAYPAVAKRQIKVVGDELFISMDVLCQATKEPCDKFVRQFQELNERMKADMRDRANGTSPRP